MDTDLHLGSFLKPGETVLWQGRPVPFRAVDADIRKAYILRCVVCAAVCAVLCVFLILRTLRENGTVQPLMPIIVFLCGVMVCIVPLSHYNKLSKSAVYLVTSRRAACYVDSAWSHSLQFAEIPAVDIAEQENGLCSLRIGTYAMSLPASAFRKYALDSITRLAGSKTKNGLLFYNLSRADADTARKLIETFRSASPSL